MPWKLIATMVFISIVWDRLSSSLAILNHQDPKAGWLFKFSATVVVGVAVVAYVWRHTRTRINNSRDPDVSAHDDPELTCCCGLRARLRISRTSKNPYRLFYNCPRHIYHHQCDFFRWCDETMTTIERCLEEKNFLREECIQLQERINYLRSRREHDRVVWEREKSELRLKLSAVQTELDDIMKRIHQVIESDAMPPFDDSYEVDDDHDGVVVVGTVQTSS